MCCRAFSDPRIAAHRDIHIAAAQRANAGEAFYRDARLANGRIERGRHIRAEIDPPRGALPQVLAALPPQPGTRVASAHPARSALVGQLRPLAMPGWRHAYCPARRYRRCRPAPGTRRRTDRPSPAVRSGPTPRPGRTRGHSPGTGPDRWPASGCRRPAPGIEDGVAIVIPHGAGLRACRRCRRTRSGGSRRRTGCPGRPSRFG